MEEINLLVISLLNELQIIGLLTSTDTISALLNGFTYQ